MRSGRVARPWKPWRGWRRLEGCGAFSRANQQVDVGVEDVFAGVVGALFAVVGGGHGYQSNRLKLYRPVGIVNLRLWPRPDP